jgi:uncharacterized protein (TIGR03435 family)
MPLRMRPLLFVFVATIVASSSAQPTVPQTPVSNHTFDVVSIRPSDPLNDHLKIQVSAGTLTATISIKTLIEQAYGIQDFQLSGGPGWLDSSKYDIIAKSSEMGDPSKLEPSQEEAYQERWGQMLQSLLIDRFQLKVHHSTKELPVYALVVAKGGPKLKDAKPHALAVLYTQTPGQLRCSGASMPAFAKELLELGLGRYVLDKTGLAGRYDFTLHWTPDADLDGSASKDASGPSLFTAVQEQLGLKLESTRGPVPTLVIDHVERPSEN